MEKHLKYMHSSYSIYVNDILICGHYRHEMTEADVQTDDDGGPRGNVLIWDEWQSGHTTLAGM